MTEDELHAYVDGELPADRREAVEAWLAEHPEQAALVAAWRAQAEAIRARYGAVANEPVPARLEARRADHARRRALVAGDGGRGRGRRLLVGGGAGWMARGASAAAPTEQSSSFTADALDAHKLYIVEVRHPVEVPGRRARSHDAVAVEAARLRAAGSRSAAVRPEAASAAGCCRAPTGAAALFMYEGADGERFTHLLRARRRRRRRALRFR